MLTSACAGAVARVPRESSIRVGTAELYVREVGDGPPIIVLHGGPDFDHTYLLPEMDALADSFRLIYYDQRGRGASARGVAPEDVSLESEMADLDAVREHFGSPSVTLLGHSFGTVLALEYAVRHPDRVTALILMNPAPASHADFLLLKSERARRWPEDVARLKLLAATDGYRRADPDAVAAYYRVHFRAALARPEDVEKVVVKLRASFTPEAILKARKIETRIYEFTWFRDDYDLLPKLGDLRIPTLVLGGDHEFIPEECAAHIAQAIPGARRVTFRDCGHFSYLECPADVRRELDAFFKR